MEHKSRGGNLYQTLANRWLEALAKVKYAIIEAMDKYEKIISNCDCKNKKTKY